LKNRILLIGLMALLIAGCNTINLFEKNVAVPDNAWKYEFQPEIDFDIADTTSFYNIFFVFRHTEAFAFNNIWVKVTSTSPGDSASTTQQFDFPLTSQNRWTGSAMDDIYEHRIMIYNGPVKFKRSGKYKVKLQQVMRESPLHSVLNVGLRVEKVKT
jgi:gliding motility-associated lipoprotein GldH